ncbi:Phosphatidylinositol 3,4,5-trisphosphate-dependent Rac exchanger 2 protein [Tilletia horrida]|uniref:Phosphatidylinositol 3,4,5-trisphosphate-dependent Rac exchanger 2 protein n=1 Tax=Tilletia horrida TaxID=155126 RepID=A0AAN6GBS0_9BASI|nr:Phosphatidylinositol 3,4,5-trisphosphate-dependent Rac exchanger 2 protein [Tilletia horrida]
MAVPRPAAAAAASAASRTPFVSSPIPPPPHRGAKMDVRDGALVWIDCEMTGLTDKDRIIEIACIITDGDLNPVDEGVQYVIKTEKSVLDAMGPWCVSLPAFACRKYREFMPTLSSPPTHLGQKRQHGEPHDHVRAAILAYVLDRVPVKGQACLAGNSVHADKVFLDREMPELTEHLSYRIVDVSSLKELVSRWYGKAGIPNKASDHRALSDIKGSIEELKHYKTKFFRASGK